MSPRAHGACSIGFWEATEILEEQGYRHGNHSLSQRNFKAGSRFSVQLPTWTNSVPNTPN